MMNLLKLSAVFKTLKNSSLCLFMFFYIVALSQNQPIKTTTTNNTTSTEITEDELFKATKVFVAAKEFDKALLILTKNYNRFSESLNINWLYAHVLSLNNDKVNADAKFKKAISLSPNNKNLQKDYARFLYEIGKLNEVEAILSKYIAEDSKDVEFLLMQANISFWNGDVKTAKENVAKIKEIYPETNLADNLSRQIKELTAFYLNANFEYQTDSQPLEYFAQHIALEKYISKFLNPKLEVSNYNFTPQTEQALIVRLNNKFHFYEVGLKINVNGGVYKNFSGETDWLGGFQFTQQLSQEASINFGYSKNSLLSTVSSTAFNLTNQNIFGEFDYNHKYVAIHAAYNQQFYEDDNNIKLFGAYIVSQPIKLYKFSFQAGYGYNFSDSKNILFVYDDLRVGMYDPYFTPKEQEIHSALFITNFKPTKNLTFKAKLNYGIQASVRNPFSSEVTPNNFEIGGFYDETFSYTEIEGSINYAVSNSFGINAMYTFQETFFYDRNNINIGLNYRF
jgi:Tfp pilus assembly protein PilF